jgi:7-carboxy-7-deazaguanine synthase
MLINEIFTSIDGEVNKWGQGVLTTFIRTQGCNLRCSYCDTPKALDENDDSKYAEMSVNDVVNEVVTFGGCDKVTITGGEPLEQPDIFMLIDALLHEGIVKISVETNGTHPIPTPYINRFICWVVDYKWEYRNKIQVNFQNLSETDWIKFVVGEANVVDTFAEIKAMRREGVKARMAVSALDDIEHKDLLQLIFREKVDVSLNVQLHKLINVA